MKQKGPGLGFRHGWIQALRQGHQEAASSQLLMRLPSAMASPAVLPPGDSLGGHQASHAWGRKERGLGVPAGYLAPVPASTQTRRAGWGRPPPQVSVSLQTRFLPGLGSWASGLPIPQLTLPALPSPAGSAGVTFPAPRAQQRTHSRCSVHALYMRAEVPGPLLGSTVPAAQGRAQRNGGMEP